MSQGNLAFLNLLGNNKKSEAKMPLSARTAQTAESKAKMPLISAHAAETAKSKAKMPLIGATP